MKLNMNLVFTNEKLKQIGIIDKQTDNKYDRTFTATKSNQIFKPNVSLQSKSNTYFEHFLCFRPQGMTELLRLDARKIWSHAL